MHIKNLYNSKTVKGMLIGMIAVVFVLIIFQAGVWVGYHKAAFSFGLGEGYYRTFEGHHPEFMFGVPSPHDLPGGHGAVGKIVRVSLPTFVVASPDNVEKVVLINHDTQVRRFHDEVPTSDLNVDDFVVVLGSPNKDGQIDARFIRLMPPPPNAPPITTSSTTPRTSP